ncbi:MAG: DUF4156 domain-containing protein [Gammaproteobacteria bacterium]|nr:DUF4156 domain-containing protein [Gammaproteobacteria bacterium]
MHTTLRASVSILALLTALMTASACRWVKPVAGAETVDLVPANLVGSCAEIGGVTVSALDKVGFLERHEDEVQEDLASLAKNHAVERGGDTIVRASKLENGEQKFLIYKCQEAGHSDTQAIQPASDSNTAAETVPYEG